MKIATLALVTAAMAFTTAPASAEDSIDSAPAAENTGMTFEALDTNKDASLDQSELKDDELLNQFSSIDTDGNNLISAEEYKMHKEQVLKEGQAAR